MDNSAAIAQQAAANAVPVDEDAIAAQALAAAEAAMQAQHDANERRNPAAQRASLEAIEAEIRRNGPPKVEERPPLRLAAVDAEPLKFRLPAAPEPPRTVEAELELLDEIADSLMALAGIVSQRIGAELDDQPERATTVGSIIDRIYFARQRLGAVRDRLTDALTALG